VLPGMSLHSMVRGLIFTADIMTPALSKIARTL
jgi:hypothetical protein